MPKPLAIMDFDTENVPGFYWYDDKTTDILHTIAWGWVGEDTDVLYTTTVWKGNEGLGLTLGGWNAFIGALAKADILTGHNIRRHDLPLLNAYAAREGLAPIKWPKTVDTLTDFNKHFKGMSRSQEYLGMLHDLEQAKMQVGLYTWEKAARGDAAASAIVVERCVSDVEMHMKLYQALTGGYSE